MCSSCFSFDLEKCLAKIMEEDKRKDFIISDLRKDNRELQDERYSDIQMAEMKKELEKARSDSLRGFPITEEEEKAIEKWKLKHDKEAHGLDEFNRYKAGGAIGGRYRYSFVPTSIGTIGEVICDCGARFEFQSL